MDKICITCRAIETSKWYSGPLCRKCYQKLPHVTILRRASLKRWADSHVEERAIRKHEWYEDNIESERIRRAIWYQENQEQEYQRTKSNIYKRRQIDLNFNLAGALRRRLHRAVKKDYKAGSAVKDLGCSIDFLKQYLEQHWLPEMSWENWGFGKNKWHIDHIIPLSNFNLVDPEQVQKACHYTNLQPLWQSDNLKKSNKLL